MDTMQRTIERLTGAILILGAIVDDEVNCPGNDRNSTVRETISDMVSDAWQASRADRAEPGKTEPGKTSPDEVNPDKPDQDKADPDKPEPDEAEPSNFIYTKGGYVDYTTLLKALMINTNDSPTVILDRDHRGKRNTNDMDTDAQPDKQDRNKEVD